jgi:tetratricopeptide (TPR) repeat protein
MRQQQGLLDEAETLIRSADTLAREHLGDRNPITLWVMERMANIVGDHGEPGVALHIQRELNELKKRAWGNSEEVILAQGGLAATLLGAGHYGEAVDAQRTALRRMRELEISEGGIVGSLRLYMMTLEAVGDEESARPIAQELLEIRRQAAETADRDAYILNAYARELLQAFPADLRDPPKAMEMALRAFEVSSEEYHYNRFTLGLAYEANGMLEESAAMLQRAMAHAPIEAGGSRNQYESALIRVLEKSGKVQAAEDHCRNTLAKRRVAFESPHPDIALSLEVLGDLLFRQKRSGEAEVCLREALEIRTAIDPTHWRCGLTEIQLAGTLAALNRTEEFEAMIDEGLRLLEEHPYTPRTRLKDAYITTGDIYQSLGREELARHFAAMANSP